MGAGSRASHRLGPGLGNDHVPETSATHKDLQISGYSPVHGRQEGFCAHTMISCAVGGSKESEDLPRRRRGGGCLDMPACALLSLLAG